MTTLYKHYDKRGTPLYIGISDYPVFYRMANHARQSNWWGEVQCIILEHYDTHEELIAAEKKAIEEERPLYNRTHHPDLPPAVRVRYYDRLGRPKWKPA